MGWPDAVRLLEHWRSSPPTNELLGRFMRAWGVDAGGRPASDEAGEAIADASGVSESEFEALLRRHGIDGMVAK